VRAAGAAAAGLLLALPGLVSGQTTTAPPAPPAATPWPGYAPQILRWQEDYAGLKDVAPGAGFPLDLKYIPLGDDDWLTLGGEYRFRVDSYGRPDFGEGHAPSFTSLQHRFMLHADAHLGPDVRVFLQAGAGLEDGRPFKRPGDRGLPDIAQAFVDVNFGPKTSRWRLRVGRQEVAFGRYIAIRDGTNFPLTFDGARLDGAWDGWTFLALAARATRQRPKDIDDANSHDRIALGMAEHALSLQGFKLDLVLAEHDRDAALYAVGPGAERRGTTGARLYGAWRGWDGDAQASYQFGHYTPRGRREMAIRAYGAAFEGGRSFAGLWASPRLALRVDYASGDDRNGRLGTFDLPYPNLTYLTDAAIISPRNVHDVQPFVAITPAPAVTLTAGAELLWRNSLKDSVYSPAFTPVVPPGGRGRYVATQPYLRLDWRVMPLIEVQGGVETALPGEALKSFGGRRDLDFGYAAWIVRF
jgi:hypothetical protein